MNGDGYRLVAITKEQRDAIGVLLNIAGHHMPMPEHEALAWEALDGWNDAPADPAEAIRTALLAAEHRSPGMGGEPEPLHDLYMPLGATIIRARAVLGALGATRETHT